MCHRSEPGRVAGGSRHAGPPPCALDHIDQELVGLGFWNAAVNRNINHSFLLRVAGRKCGFNRSSSNQPVHRDHMGLRSHSSHISANTSNLTNSGSWNAFLMPTPETRFVFDSTVIQLQPTLAQQHHRKQCNHAKRRVALAVPPFIHPDSLRRRLCTFSRLQKGQGSSKTPRTRGQNLPYLFAILGFLPTIETPNTVEISTVCQPAECFLWSSEGDLPAPVDSCC